ncbi:hypothetical protein M8S10_10035 [Enterobacter chuandaensis]|uniref:hypothetical protein n=1 Tax=Enterobacter chuandaensis TaxID=2497875 RepID=UPI002074C187|nr:hypothetical protein [Enterobacter chuandaensis]MCM7589155.1 hypothetical protein [Enterobacter chuandaensis]
MQKVKSLVVAGALTLLVGGAEAAPTTELPQAPAKKTQPVLVNNITETVKKDLHETKAKLVSAPAEPAQQKTETKPAPAAPKLATVSSSGANKKKEKASAAEAQAEAAKQEEAARQEAAANTEVVQDRLASIVEDDYAFEQQRRKLANEVELEKLRSQIRKLRGEDKMKPAPRMAAQEPIAKPQAPAAAPAAAPIVMPRVVLEADIGGTNRVAVLSGDTLRYVRAGETFDMGGRKFKLAKDRKSVVMAEEAVQ